MQPSIYLAGPITGLTFGESESWRDLVKRSLKQAGIDCFSPLRAQEHTLRHRGILLATSYEDDPMTSADGIMFRDHWDVKTRDLTFANVLAAKEKSIGTSMELAWAYAYCKPVVLVMEKTGNVHEHCMFRKAGVFSVQTLGEGIELAKAILLPS
jgi:nucleoside 2-deoxyribosyltransferase